MKLIRQLWYILTPKERMEGGFLLVRDGSRRFFRDSERRGRFPLYRSAQGARTFIQMQDTYNRLLSRLDVSDPRRQLFFILGLILIALFAIKMGYLIQLYRWLFRYAMKKHVNLARQLLAGYLGAPYTLHLQRNSAELIR